MNGRRKDAFTLLEVLAAAIIFAMVVTVLVGTSSTAVHRIGTSTRELEADQLADSALADIEIQLQQGIAPAVEEEETEVEDFVVRTSRRSFAPEGTAASPAGRPARPVPGTLPSPSVAGSDVASLLGASLPEVARFLVEYDVEVSWLEQDAVHSVHRTTFAFDWESAATEYADLFARASAGGTRGGPGGGATGSDDESLPPGVDGRNLTEAQKAALRARQNDGDGGFTPRRAFSNGELIGESVRPR